MTRVPLFTYKLMKGDTYTIAHDPDIDDGGSASVHIENPSDSDRVIVIEFQLKTESSSTGTYYINTDVSGGSDADPTNDLIGDDQTSFVNVTMDGTLSNADSSIDFPLSADAGPNQTIITERPPIAIQPGNSIAVEVESQSDGNQTLFFFTIWETS